jgi:hypothetical protein
MRTIERWLGLAAMLLMAYPGPAEAQGTTAFDGSYLGVAATNLGGMGERGSTRGCQTFAKPAPLTIANGHAQAPWASDTLDGQVNPDGSIRMKAQRFAGTFDGRIANQTITGRYQGGCNYDLTWRKRPG